jgi:4-hydroxybenzoate polyprenyltransferase
MIKHFLIRTIESIENFPLTIANFTMSFFALIFARLMIENALIGLFQERTFFYFFFEFTHTFLFFLFAFMLLIPVARFAGEVDFTKAINFLLCGFIIILTPPIIDAIIFHGGQFWSFYEFDGLVGLLKRYITLFGDTPNMGITYGTRVEVVIVTLALGFYSFLKSRRVAKALSVSLIGYSILFVLGTFPSWLTLGIMFFQKSFLAINQNDVATLFLTPENIFNRNITDFRSVLNVKMSIVYGALAVFLAGITVWREYRNYFRALWKNARLPQIVYHGGLLFIGMGAAFLFTSAQASLDFFHIMGAFVLLASVESAWLASVVVNDCYDMQIDRETNVSRPLIKNTIPLELYKTFGVLFFITSLILSGIISFSAMLILLGYQAFAWLYSTPPLRLKRFPIVATALAAFSGTLILIAGFLVVSPVNGISTFPLPLLFFLFAAYTLVLPVKDFKDIKGDALDCIYTIPVLLGAEKAKLLIGSLIFLLYITSPVVLNANALFWPAFLFGSLSFWSIQKSVDNEAVFFSYRKLSGIILALVAVYGITIVYLLF